MTRSRKLALAALLALLILPTAAPAQAENRDSCDVSQHDDDCKREKPRFQTRFFSE
jgi:hypothetical protein